MANFIRRARSERGASLVEFALVLPILCLLVFGIAEFGIAFNNYIAIRNGVREGARQAVVARFGSDSTCTVTGYGGSGDTRSLMCLTKGRTGLDNSKMRLKVTFPNGYAVGNSVVVCAEYPVESITKLFQPILGSRVLHAKTEMRIEQTANPSSDFGTAASETSQSSSNPWSGCS